MVRFINDECFLNSCHFVAVVRFSSFKFSGLKLYIPCVFLVVINILMLKLPCSAI